MKRFMILLSALVMQMCLGATYTWSVFVRPLRDVAGLSQGAAQLPFSVFYFAFPATMILSGSFLRLLGVKIVISKRQPGVEILGILGHNLFGLCNTAGIVCRRTRAGRNRAGRLLVFANRTDVEDQKTTQ